MLLLGKAAASLFPPGSIGRRGLPLARLVAAAGVALAVIAIASLHEHDPYNITAGFPARVIAGLVPLVAAAVCGYAVLRPWRGFVAMMLLTPIFDVAQIHWEIGSLQVIAQTLCVAALAIGVALRGSAAPAEVAPATAAAPGHTFGRDPVRIAGIALVAFVVLAAVSTALSPDVGTSSTVLLHGVAEPVALGLILFALRPSRRELAVVLVVIGVSVGIGGLLDIVQTVPTMKSLSVMQANRLLFTRLTYFNVGLFGAMLAMALPLLAAGFLARRRLGLGPVAVIVLAAATLAALASLYLTFSKSAYLASAAGVLVFLLLIIRSRRRRITLVATAALISAVVIPWPGAILQVVPPLEQAYRNAVVSLVGQSRYDSWNPSTLSGRGSLLERWYATRAAAEMALDHPVLGIGLDQFKAQYVGHYKPPEAHLDLDSAHTFWPEIAAELGLPALSMIVLVFAAALIALWRVYRDPPDRIGHLLAATLLASMAAWLVVATTFDIDLYRPWRCMSSDVVMMSVLVAASFTLSRLGRDAAGTDAATDWRLT